MIDSARNYLLGQFPTRLETALQLSSQFAILEVYGLDTAYIDEYGEALAAVNVETIVTVIEEVYPNQEDLVFVLLGDAAQIRERAADYGPVTEMPITAPSFADAEVGKDLAQ